MAKNDFSLLVKAKLDTSEITSKMNEIKNKYGSFKLKLEFDKMPNLGSQMSSEGSKAGQKYSEAFQKAMSEKIKFHIDTGDFQTKLDTLKAKLETLGGKFSITGQNVRELESVFATLNSDKTSIDDKIDAFQRFNALLPVIRTQLSQTSDEARKNAAAFKETANAQLTMQKSSTLSNNIQIWMNNNEKAAKQYGDRLRELQNQLKNNTDPSKLREVSAEFQNIKSEAGKAGLSVNQWGLQFKNAITMALGIGSVYQIINKVIQVTKEMVKQTIELEDAMAQFRIVTKATESQMNSFYQTTIKNAKQIGGNVKDMTEAATTFARLGFSLEESSTLAKYTSMLQSVGDIDVSSAESALTAVFKAFDLNINDIEAIMDKLIEVGNNYPISVAELAEGINNAGSMLAAAGNSYEETIALLTAANTTVQDISKSSTGLRTVAARLRNTKTELDELGEAMTEAQYDALVQGLTKANVALTDAQGNFRSTYDIIKDLAKVWNQLSNMDQAALAKNLAGTRQQNVFFSLIEQFQEAENAMQSMEESTGALSDAMAVFESTTTAHLNNLKTAFLDLANSLFESSFLQFFIDLGTHVLEGINAVAEFIDKIGGLKTVILAVCAVLLIFKGDIILLRLELLLLAAQEKLIALWTALKTGIMSIVHIIPTAIAAWKAYAAGTMSASAAMEASIPVIGLVLAAITLLVGGLALASNSAEDAEDEAEKTSQKIKEAATAAKQSSTELFNLATAFISAKSAMANLTGSVDSYVNARKALIDSLKIEQSELDTLIGKYGDYDTALLNATLNRLKGDAIDLWAGVLEYGDQYAVDLEYPKMFAYNLTETPENKEAIEAAGKALGEHFGDSFQMGFYAAHSSDYSEIIDIYNNVFPDIKEGDNWKMVRGQGVADFLNTYAYYEEALTVLADTVGRSNPVYQAMDEQFQQMKTDGKEFLDAIQAWNDNLSNQLFLETQIEQGLPHTQEEFDAFRDAFINKIKDSGEFLPISDIDKEVGDYVDGILRNLPEVTVYYNVEASPDFNPAQAAAEAKEKVKEITDNIFALQSVVSKQSTGESISLDDFNAKELKDYTSALEYHNGVLQLNAEKTRELVEAKTENQLATISENKAIAQSKYLQNAAEIERLTNKIRNNSYEVDENKELVEAQIRNLQSENSALLVTCTQYDLMSASLREATDTYHNWLNAQKASQAGDMFDDTLDAINRINDTLNNTDSDYFGRVGRTDYQAALDLIIPDTVDREDKDAINAYLESVADLFTYDDKGNRAGLNITNFCKQAVEQGLMVFDEASNSYLVAGQTTMEDFAEGMNLSLPLVQAMFGEMEEFGGKFSWADEAVKTLGDLAISADVAANRLRESHGEFGFDIKLDYSDLDTTAEKIGAIEDTISNMKFMRIDVGSYDPSAVEDCDAVLQYLIMQKQQLSAPAVMDIDISKVSENTGAALQLLQDFQNACNDLELKQELGLDTTDAQAKVDTLYAEIAGSDNDALLTLGIDTTSIDTVKTSLGELSQEEVLTKLNLDTTVLNDYTPEDKEATVTYNVDTSAVDAYNPKNLQRTVTYYVRTSGMDKLNGTAHAAGTAFASGDWGTAPGGETLTGELGREIVVDPHTGKWYTVGDYGAEFVNIPRGAIVFNHKQTEQLLKNGYVAGRATALVGGTAMVTGGIGADNADSGTGSGGNKPYSGGGNSGGNSSSSSSSSSSSKSSDDKEPQIIDWIEIAIARIERGIKKLQTIAESTYKSLKTKLGAAYDEIAKVNQEIAIQQQAYNRYMKQAESVGLSSTLKEKVKNGTIDINEYDEDTQKLIKDYQQWYEKALDCADAVDELHESLAKLYEGNFNATQEDFENKLSLIEHMTKMYQSGIDMFEAKGYLESTKFYKAMQAANSQQISTLNEELTELQKKFSEAMASGEIEEGSEAWYKMQQEINACKEAIADANVESAQLAKTIREIEWGYFDYEQERISQLTQEADFLIDLMSNQKLHDDKGQLTDYGMATMGLHGQNYNVYMAQADDYAQQILELNEQIANDPYNTDLIKRREELIRLQQESIKNAESEKQAIVELVKQGIQLELNALKDLISAYTESLDNAKALYEYQSKVADKAAEIARLQKQLAAYSGDTSEETQATVQKLQVDLSKAQEDLAKTEYEQFISDQKKLLSELYDEYEEILNQRLDDVDALISDMIDSINGNSDTINETLGNVAADVGYTLTPQMQEIWDNSTGSTEGVISKYGDDFSEKLTAVNSVLAGIHANVADMVDHSDEQAESDTAGVAPTSDPTPPSDGGGGSPGDSGGSDSGGGTGSGAVLDDLTKKKVAAAIWRGGLGWGVNPDRAKRLKEVFGEGNGIQALVNQGVGKNDGSNDVKNYTYLAMRKKFKGYKSGGLVDYTGLAKVDGTPQKPELMLNSTDAANFIALRDTLRALATQPISIGKQLGLDAPAFSGIADMSDRLTSMRTPVGNTGTTFGDFEINIPIDHVQDYPDFVRQLRSDPQFEEMIIGMTLGRAVGKSSLNKYKYQW